VKQVKLPTLAIWAPVTVGHTSTKQQISYDIIHGHYCITWLPVYLESWPQFRI